jgi:hypothetical protein
MLTVHSKWKAWTATVATILLAASFGVMEVILIFALQVSTFETSSCPACLLVCLRAPMIAALSGR